MPNCPKCAAEVAAEDNFCRVCGAFLHRQGQRPRSNTVQQLISEYRQAIADNPDDESARYSLGLAYLYEGQPAAAAEQLVEVTRLVPDFADAYAKLAIAFSQMRNYSQAQQAIDQARELQPHNEEYHRIAQRLER